MCGKASIDAVRTVTPYDVAADSRADRRPPCSPSRSGCEPRRRSSTAPAGCTPPGCSTPTATCGLPPRGRRPAQRGRQGRGMGGPARGASHSAGSSRSAVARRSSSSRRPRWPASRCLAAVSAPSSLAVDLASEVGMTLVGFLRGASYNVYTCPARITGGRAGASGGQSRAVSCVPSTPGCLDRHACSLREVAVARVVDPEAHVVDPGAGERVVHDRLRAGVRGHAGAVLQGGPMLVGRGLVVEDHDQLPPVGVRAPGDERPRQDHREDRRQAGDHAPAHHG